MRLLYYSHLILEFRPAGFLVQLLIIASSIYIAGGRILFFFDVISLLFDFSMLFAVLFFTRAFKPFINGWGFVLFKDRSGTRDDLNASADSWCLAINILLATGATGFLIGLVLMLVNLNEPSMVGPYLAVALICLLYALVIILILVPGRYVLLRKINESRQDNG